MSIDTLPLVPKLHVAHARVDAWPLAAQLVVDGQPQARGCVLSKSDDVRQVRGIWDCTPGRFRWDWDYDETVVVVSGRATVDVGRGTQVELGPGDMAFFPSGTRSVWTIHEPFRKAFHASAPQPLPF
jgi:uncharacterized cupin superfamily protein